jgi:hypothetical protein
MHAKAIGLAMAGGRRSVWSAIATKSAAQGAANIAIDWWISIAVTGFGPGSGSVSNIYEARSLRKSPGSVAWKVVNRFFDGHDGGLGKSANCAQLLVHQP